MDSSSLPRCIRACAPSQEVCGSRGNHKTCGLDLSDNNGDRSTTTIYSHQQCWISISRSGMVYRSQPLLGLHSWQGHAPPQETALCCSHVWKHDAITHLQQVWRMETLWPSDSRTPSLGTSSYRRKTDHDDSPVGRMGPLEPPVELDDFPS
jgi:hypothetical protein